MKKLIILTFVLFLLSACSSNKDIANITQTEENAKAAVANNVPSEYKQVTTNENGVKIYGKKLDEKDPMYEKIYDPLGDKNQAKRGYSYTYTRYDSPAYGGTVYIKTCNEDGGQEIYNENGECFASGKAVTDMEKWLANYRLGNAIAGAMDKKYKGK